MFGIFDIDTYNIGTSQGLRCSGHLRCSNFARKSNFAKLAMFDFKRTIAKKAELRKIPRPSRSSNLRKGAFAPSGLPKPLPLGATATTAASGGNREELLGQRPAGCERQRSRRWEPQPGQWHCEAMTERASPARKSRCAAMGRLFVRAILSLCKSCLSASLPSQSGLRPPAPPKGEPLACRSAFVWTPEARQGAKGRALLQRVAASGQAHLVKLP